MGEDQWGVDAGAGLDHLNRQSPSYLSLKLEALAVAL